MINRKKITALVLALAITAALLPSASAFSYTQMTSELGIRGYEITTVAPEAQYIDLSASNSAGNQRIHAVEFDPKSEYTALRAGKSQGYVWSTQTVPTIANNMSNTNGGDVAVAAVNGDFFTFGVGVPHGIFIEDGIILSTPPQYYAAFGITYDNEPFITRHGTILDKVFRIDGALVDVAGINMAHTKDADSLMLYTEEYARGTKTGTETYELRCVINSGEVRHGDTLNFTVTEINDAVGNTTLGDGYIVLSAQGARIDDLKKLNIGDTLEMTFRFNEFWSNVKFAVGGIELLLKDGEVYSTADSSNQPRTSVGIRADGTVVLATMDGRGAGDAKGMSYKAAAEAMRALGCIDALNLDGGGSTTFVLRSPGALKANIVNNVSGGSARQVANALVLMNTAPTLDYPTKLSISPAKRTVMLGGEYSFSVIGAYDENYKPHNIPSNISWNTNSSNEINESGSFSATSVGEATISARSDAASGEARITVVDDVTEITLDATEVSMRAGESFELKASATLNGTAVEGAQELYTWSAPETLGEFTAPGKFTLSETAIEGEIIVSYGSAKAVCRVTPRTEPIEICNFENGPTFFAVGIGTKTAPSVKYNSTLQYSHSGDRSLKMYYNFLGATDSVGAYLTMYGNTESFTLNALPKSFSMMVYGDGSGVELRSIIEDAFGSQHSVSYGTIDHIGWKKMDARVPENITGPIFIKAPIHLVSNPKAPSQGNLYFDNFRAIYSAINEDTTSPTIEKVWPENGMSITSGTPSLGIIVKDDSAIDKDSIKLYVNGNECISPEYDKSTGKISYTIKNELKDGLHTAVLFVRDKSGNPLFKDWFFEVKK